MITTIRDTNTTLKVLKKAVLVELRTPGSTTHLVKRLGYPPRPMREVLKALHQEGRIVYDVRHRQWTLS